MLARQIREMSDEINACCDSLNRFSSLPNASVVSGITLLRSLMAEMRGTLALPVPRFSFVLVANATALIMIMLYGELAYREEMNAYERLVYCIGQSFPICLQGCVQIYDEIGLQDLLINIMELLDRLRETCVPDLAGWLSEDRNLLRVLRYFGIPHIRLIESAFVWEEIDSQFISYKLTAENILRYYLILSFFDSTTIAESAETVFYVWFHNPWCTAFLRAALEIYRQAIEELTGNLSTSVRLQRLKSQQLFMVQCWPLAKGRRSKELFLRDMNIYQIAPCQYDQYLESEDIRKVLSDYIMQCLHAVDFVCDKHSLRNEHFSVRIFEPAFVEEMWKVLLTPGFPSHRQFSEMNEFGTSMFPCALYPRGLRALEGGQLVCSEKQWVGELFGVEEDCSRQSEFVPIGALSDIVVGMQNLRISEGKDSCPDFSLLEEDERKCLGPN